jgi:DNA-binding response OmpR family regulator
MATISIAGVNASTADLRRRVERILLVEHDEALQKVIREALTVEGYEVEVVSNGTAGLELIRQKTHSGLIVDLQLPGLSTWDLCRRKASAFSATLWWTS